MQRIFRRAVGLTAATVLFGGLVFLVANVVIWFVTRGWDLRGAAEFTAWTVGSFLALIAVLFTASWGLTDRKERK